MAVQNINQLKQWFKTGDKPTQQQFYDWLDSFRHRSETVAISEVDELPTVLQNKADVVTVNYLLPVMLPYNEFAWKASAGTLIEKILIISDVDLIVNIGTSNEGNEIAEGVEVNHGYGIVTVDYFIRTDTTIYFTGVTSNTIIKIYRK
jgi:hypothetical protein